MVLDRIKFKVVEKKNNSFLAKDFGERVVCRVLRSYEIKFLHKRVIWLEQLTKLLKNYKKFNKLQIKIKKLQRRNTKRKKELMYNCMQ